jgi:hypothetical protein
MNFANSVDNIKIEENKCDFPEEDKRCRIVIRGVSNDIKIRTVKIIKLASQNDDVPHD